MKIFVDEEYGYRYWCWTPKQESLTGLIEDWDRLTDDERSAIFFDPTRLGGQWEQIAENGEEYSRDIYVGYLNINNADDVRLILDDANVY